jgi:hypothetical protein
MEKKTIIILCVIIISIIIIGILIFNKSNEKYPNVGDVKNFALTSHFNERDLLSPSEGADTASDIIQALQDRYSMIFMSPTPAFSGKFNKGYCMFLYLLIGNMYTKEFSWNKFTSAGNRQGEPYNTNKLIWRIGAAEYLTSKNEGGFLRDTIKRIDKKMAICNEEIFRWREDGIQPSYGCMPQDVDIMGAQRSRILRVLENDSITNNGVLNFIFGEINQLNPSNQDILGEIDFRQVFGGGNRWKSKLAKRSITARTSPDVYNFTIDANRNYLSSSPRINSRITNPTEIPLYTWVQNFGLCTDTSPIDYGQPIVRTIGTIYRFAPTNTYIVCMRGIVYDEEMSAAFKAEPTILPGNREVHSGFYNLFTNQPVKYGDSQVIQTPYDVINGMSIFTSQMSGFNRNDMYTLYEEKGSLQTQWRAFLDSLSANKEVNIVICGHSMGAALTQMMLTDLLGTSRSAWFDRMMVYLLNSPRCINVDVMREITTSLNGRIYDIQNTDDFLTSLPVPYLEPAAITKTIYNEIDGDWDYRDLTYIDWGWHYCHFTNIIGYNYNVDDFKKNHFMEGADYGTDRFFDIIYTPTFDMTSDIIFNGIYQKLLNNNKVPRSIEGRRACFIGTSNPSFWIRQNRASRNIQPLTLFPDFYPEKWEQMNTSTTTRNQFRFTLQAILLLIIDLHTFRATNEFKSATAAVVAKITTHNENINSSSIVNYASREHVLWHDLWIFFNLIFTFYIERKPITTDLIDFKEQNLGFRLQSLLRMDIDLSQGGNNLAARRRTLKAVTRTLYLIICPPNLKRNSKKMNFIYGATLCLFGALNFANTRSINLFFNRDYDENAQSFAFYRYYNAYRKRLGLYYDDLNNDISEIVRLRNEIGYDDFDWRSWEMLFGGVGQIDNPINFFEPIIISPIMSLSDSYIVDVNTKFGEIKRQGTRDVINILCEEDNTCTDLREQVPINCITTDNKNIIPIPGYNKNIMSECNSGDLLDRYGRNLVDCFNTYDPVLSETFVKIFDKGVDTIDGVNLRRVITTLGNTPSTVVQNVRDYFNYGPEPYIQTDVIKLNIPQDQSTDIYLVTINGLNMDNVFNPGRDIFDRMARDLVYAIKTQNYGNISNSVSEMYNEIIDYYQWAGPIAAGGGALGIIFGSTAVAVTGGIAVIVAAVIGILLWIAESSSDNDTARARKLLTLLPYGIIKKLIEENLPDVEGEITEALGSSSNLINYMVNKYIDVLIGEDFSILDPDLPNFVSFKRYVGIETNQPVFNEYFDGNNEDNTFNLYYTAVSLYEKSKRSILETLESEIMANPTNPRDFHIYVTGYGTGGAVAQCMLLDSINKFKNTWHSNARTRFKHNMMTFYTYASPLVMNTSIINFISSKQKPILYNLMNLDDYFTSFPATYLTSMTAKRNRKRYCFTHYPSTMVFNLPNGLKVNQGTDYQNGGEKYNYNKKAHSPNTYMTGLADLHNKIIGEWFMDRTPGFITTDITTSLLTDIVIPGFGPGDKPPSTKPPKIKPKNPNTIIPGAGRPTSNDDKDAKPKLNPKLAYLADFVNNTDKKLKPKIPKITTKIPMKIP